MHAEEWIQKHGRYRRTMPLTELRKSLERQKGECTWCGGKCPSNYHRYCSHECNRMANVRCNAGQMRGFVFHRDRGVCAACGLNVMRLAAACNSLRWLKARNTGVGFRSRYFIFSWLESEGFGKNFPTWEADHITPVVEGGGLCHPDDVRTLCIRCHKKETAELAARRAKKRATA